MWPKLRVALETGFFQQAGGFDMKTLAERILRGNSDLAVRASGCYPASRASELAAEKPASA